MAATDHLRSRAGGWTAGLAHLRSRTGARWFAALVATSLVLFMVWAYSIDASLGRAGSSATGLPDPPAPVAEAPGTGAAGGGGGGDGSAAAAAVPRPAWIRTPAPFDTSQLPELATTTAAMTMSPALHPRVADAMARFLQRPVLTHEQAVAQNEMACPREQLSKQVNADQLRDERQNWLAVDAARILGMRRAALDFLESRSAEEGRDALIGPGFGPDKKAVRKGSRGVVIAAGNHRTVEKAVICIKEMQRLGWKGRIEVWHFSGELEDKKDQQTLRDLGVEIHTVSAKKMPGQWKNFELKAEAILRSSFDEVLYLDSDNFPLSDVTALFDAPLFTDPRGGQAVFWPDLNRDHPDNAIHRVLGIPCHDAWELESGQILIAKSGNQGLNLAALYLAHYMQTEGWYWFSGGDKDTFRYAFLVLGIPYTPAPRWLAVVGNRFVEDGKELFCGAAMLQYGISPPRPEHADPSDPAHPEPLFMHANLLKHMHGVRQGEVFPQMRRLSLPQDDVLLAREAGKSRPLDNTVGGARDIPGRGLCSDIWTFGDGAELETVATKDAFRGLMGGFEEAYFRYGGRPGIWR